MVVAATENVPMVKSWSDVITATESIIQREIVLRRKMESPHLHQAWSRIASATSVETRAILLLIALPNIQTDLSAKDQMFKPMLLLRNEMNPNKRNFWVVHKFSNLSHLSLVFQYGLLS